MNKQLRVLSPGVLTTVQDEGRFGYEHFGVPPSGAMDALALHLANTIVGNRKEAPVLEMTVQGGRYEVLGGPCTVCVGGGVTLQTRCQRDGSSRKLAAWQAHRLLPGTELSVGMIERGMRAYLAINGGFAIAPVMGSASTLTRAGLGGMEGRALRAGDLLDVGKGTQPSLRRRCPHSAIARLYAEGPIGVMLGPQDDYFSAEQITRFLAGPYTITPQSDRMGFRLAGPQITHLRGADIVSDAIVAGSIQIPGNGQPIIAMHDRQTTGGYPKIATVIAADLSRLSQFRPGQMLRFEAVSASVALERWNHLQRQLQSLKRSLCTVQASPIFPLLSQP